MLKHNRQIVRYVHGWRIKLTGRCVPLWRSGLHRITATPHRAAASSVFLLLTLYAASYLIWPPDPDPPSIERNSVTASLPSPAPGEADVLTSLHPELQETYLDDLDDLIRRRTIRVLVNYNRTNFFLENGQPQGFEYELMQQYKRYLETRVRARSWPVTFMFIPMPFSELIPALVEGRGDVIAAGMTITPKREEKVVFTKPYLPNVREVVVTASGIEEMKSIEDLSGRRVYINTSTSYAESLHSLNESLRQQGQPEVEIVPADPKFATEDILEMVNAGIIEITISDEHLATVWAKVLPGIDVRHHLAVRSGGQIAWAVRKENPELLRSLNKATVEASAGTLLGNILFRRYFDNIRWVSNPANQENIGKLSALRPVFEEFAARNGFDWRIIAAVAFQESRLDPSAKSSAGALGLMQVRPQTAAAPAVGIQDIRSVSGNVQAGVRYLAHLRDHYFDDPTISDADRLDFMLAAYNAGPTRLQGLRVRAERSGYDPNRWTSHVENLARRHIGDETIQYVSNVNKYYVAYKLSERILRERFEAKHHLQ